MSIAEETRKPIAFTRWLTGDCRQTATSANSMTILEEAYSRELSDRERAQQIPSLGGNSTQCVFRQYAQMINKLSAGASQPVSVGFAPPSAQPPQEPLPCKAKVDIVHESLSPQELSDGGLAAIKNLLTRPTPKF